MLVGMWERTQRWECGSRGDGADQVTTVGSCDSGMRRSLGKRLRVITSVEHYFYTLDGHTFVWVKWALKTRAVVQAKR